MCGRYTIAVAADDLRAEFGVHVPAGFERRYNVAPTQTVPVVGQGNCGPRMALMRWGLIAAWARSDRDISHTINARAETLLEKPAYREPFLKRRCLVPADGFYEWKRDGRISTPHRIMLRSGRPFAFAGLWDVWLDDDGAQVFSFAIVTTPAAVPIRDIHARMPAILDAEARASWLDREAPPDVLAGLLKPGTGDDLEAYVVGTGVNSVANDSPDCIAPA